MSSQQFAANVVNMYDFMFEDVNIQVDGENPVIHTNILGCVSQGWPKPVDDSGELSGGEDVARVTRYSFYQDDDVDGVVGFSDIITLRYNIMSWRESLAFLHSNATASMAGPLWIFNNPAGHVAYGTIRFDWATSGYAYAYKTAIYIISGSAGNYTHWLYFYHGRIRPQWYAAELEYDTVYELSDHMYISEARSYVLYSGTFSTCTSVPLWNSYQSAYNNKRISLTEDYPWTGSTISATNFGYSPVTSKSGLGTATVQALVGHDRSGGYTDYSVTSFARFAASADNMMGECYPMAYFSAVDAIDEYSANLKTNQIEASQDLFGILAVVDIVKLLKALRRGDLRTTGLLIFDILDVLSDVTLLYNFAVAPTVDDYLTFATRADELKKKIARLCEPQTIRGYRRIDIPEDHFDREHFLKLQLGAKVRLSLQPDVFASVLPLRSVGLLPDLSTIWELIPFSFLADKIFPVKKQLSVVDNSFLLQAFNVDYVLTSYKLRETYDADELLTYGIGSTPVCPEPVIEYRRFERIVLRNMPFLVPGRLVAAHLSEAPPIQWDTIGALVYRFIRR
jgi:hypothetical protein